MTSPQEPTPTPTPPRRRTLLYVNPRDVLTLLVLLAAAVCIVWAIDLLTDYRWALLASGLFLAAAAYLMDDREPADPGGSP